MAIHFARCEFVQRSRGNSATRVAAYNARAIVVDDRTGERHDATRWRDDLEHHEIMLPVGADQNLARAAIISNMAEAAERRKDARIGREFILGLPNELTSEDRLVLARSFLTEHFTGKGLVAQLAIHRPHEGSLNWHAHVFVSMRRLETDRFAPKQAIDLLPTIRTSSYGAFVSEAQRWGQLWTIHQERFFYEKKLNLHVDPIAIHTEKRSYGPRRSWGPSPEHSRAAQLISEQKLRNQEAARKPEVVWEFAKQQKFDSEALRKFLAKWLPNEEEREHVRERVYEMRDNDLAADKVESHSRPLTVQDIARKLSPEYDKLLRRADEIINKTVRKDEWVIGQQEGDLRLAEYRFAERKQEIGRFRAALHTAYTAAAHLRINERGIGAWLFQDRELARWENFKGRAEHTLWAWQAHQAAHQGQWRVLMRRADSALQAIRPQAEAELKRRQVLSRDARQILAIHQQDVILTQKQRHTLRSGP